MRERGHTYADVAKKLGVAVSSVKRLFARGEFTLTRLDQICELIEISLAEILARSNDRPISSQLTVAQEQEIVSDPKLFLIAWLLVNRTSFEEIVHNYHFTEREVLRLFLRLDQLKCIELLPGNRVRLLVNRHFSWRRVAPYSASSIRSCCANSCRATSSVRRRIRVPWRRSVGSGADRTQDVFRNASRQCAEILERDRGPRESRHSAAFLLALRPWKYSGFRAVRAQIGGGRVRAHQGNFAGL